MLQDLTYPDIKLFIDSAFNNKPEFVELQKRESGYASELLKDIAQKSSGVFLWVNLVVHSLLAGLVNGDRVSDLQRRLDFLPPDLEDLYEKMLSSLDPFYLEHASQIFQNVRAANEPPSLLCLSFADEEPEFISKMEVRPLPLGEELYRADIMRRRLNSRCKGLLEVGPAVLLPIDAVDFGDVEYPTSINSCVAKENSLADLTVQYLHRTVKDFLETPQVWSRIMLACPRNYDPYLAMCRSFVAQLKCSDSGSIGTEAFQRTVLKIMLYAQSVQDRLEEGQSAQPLVSLMDEFDRAATNIHIASGTDCSWPSKFLCKLSLRDCRGVRSELTFLSLAARFGLHTYLKAKVQRGCFAHDNDSLTLLLGDAVKPRIELPHTEIREIFNKRIRGVRMVKMLLEHGAAPNKVCLTNQQYTNTKTSFQKTSNVWRDLVEHAQKLESLYHEGCVAGMTVYTIRQNYPQLVYWFLVYGADPTVDLGISFRADLERYLSKDKFDHVLAIMKAGKRQTWFRKKNPNLDSSGRFKSDFDDPPSDRGKTSYGNA